MHATDVPEATSRSARKSTYRLYIKSIKLFARTYPCQLQQPLRLGDGSGQWSRVAASPCLLERALLARKRRTDCMLMIPNTKQIASRIFDLPDPLRPVMALKDSSKPATHQLALLQVPRCNRWRIQLTADGCPDRVRLEALQDELFDSHLAAISWKRKTKA